MQAVNYNARSNSFPPQYLSHSAIEWMTQSQSLKQDFQNTKITLQISNLKNHSSTKQSSSSSNSPSQFLKGNISDGQHVINFLIQKQILDQFWFTIECGDSEGENLKPKSGLVIRDYAVVQIEMENQQLSWLKDKPIFIIKNKNLTPIAQCNSQLGNPVPYNKQNQSAIMQANRDTNYLRHIQRNQANVTQVKIPLEDMLDINFLVKKDLSLDEDSEDSFCQLLERMSIEPKNSTVKKEEQFEPFKEIQENHNQYEHYSQEFGRQLSSQKNVNVKTEVKSEDQSQKRSDAEGFMPIKFLCTFTGDWRLKARVIRKQLKTYQQKNQVGFENNQNLILQICLLDSGGSQIDATFFRQAAESFNKILFVQKCYQFANGQVKMADRRYTSVSHPYQLIFSEDAQIEECSDDSKIAFYAFTFTKIADLATTEIPKIVDLAGIILDVSQPLEIVTQRQEKKTKITASLADSSLKAISVTFWGEGDQIEYQNKIKIGKLIVLRNCRLSDYNFRSVNASSEVGDFISIPKTFKDPHIDALRTLLTQNASSSIEDFKKSVSMLSQPNSKVDFFCTISQMQSIADEEIHQPAINGQSPKPLFFRISGTIPDLKPRSSSYQGGPIQHSDLTYNSCVTCKKKLVQLPNENQSDRDRFTCENCHVVSEDYNVTYNFAVTLMDCSGSLVCGVLGNEIGEAIIGVPPRDIVKQENHNPQSQSNNREQTTGVSSLLWKDVSVLVRAKHKYWQGKIDMEYTIVRSFNQPCLPYPIADDNQMLLQKLAFFKQQKQPPPR